MGHRHVHSNKVCSSQEFQGLCIPHVQAWEHLGNEDLCPSLYAPWVQAFPSVCKHFQEVYRLGHKSSFPKRSQAFPSLYMGNAQALKLLGTTNFIPVVMLYQCNIMGTLIYHNISVSQSCLLSFLCNPYISFQIS